MIRLGELGAHRSLRWGISYGNQNQNHALSKSGVTKGEVQQLEHVPSMDVGHYESFEGVKGQRRI